MLSGSGPQAETGPLWSEVLGGERQEEPGALQKDRLLAPNHQG